eukprot:12893591-Alexandrium_andersonii.AAC.1
MRTKEVLHAVMQIVVARGVRHEVQQNAVHAYSTPRTAPARAWSYWQSWRPSEASSASTLKARNLKAQVAKALSHQPIERLRSR